MVAGFNVGAGVQNAEIVARSAETSVDLIDAGARGGVPRQCHGCSCEVDGVGDVRYRLRVDGYGDFQLGRCG